MVQQPPPGRAPPIGEATVIRPRGTATGPAGVLLPGTVLGHTYRIEAPIGQGGLGEVYRARHIELGSEHTIKVIPPALASDPKIVQRLIDEARQLARVRHDAIVNYEGLFRDEQGLRYLVMEYVDGPSLRSVLAGRRLEPDEVLRLRERLAEGLAVVHARGIIHRDISPDTIILPDGEVARAKLIDFGLATVAGARDPTLIGANLAQRVAFASPEQLGLYGGHIDSRSDIYSLGLVLAAAAIGFGRGLDMGASPAAAIAARQKPPDLAAVPVALRAVIAPMLAPKPEDRPSSLRELLKGARPAAEAGLRWRGMMFAGAGVVAAFVVVTGVAALLLRSGPGSLPSEEGGLRGRLAAVAAQYGCASLEHGLSPGRGVRLSGHVASSADLAKLRGEVEAIPGAGPVDFTVQVMPHPHCDTVALLTPYAAASGRDAPSLAFASKRDEAFVGERPSFDVRAPGFDGYLYIDYFDSGSGQVLHLFPNASDRFNLRPLRNHFVLFKQPVWTICGNPGRQLMTLVAAPRPLFRVQRPEVENADDYLAALGEGLKANQAAKPVASLLFFDLRPAPPWINRDLSCPAG